MTFPATAPVSLTKHAPAGPTGLQRFWPSPTWPASVWSLAGALVAGVVAATLLPGHAAGLGVAVTAAVAGAAVVPTLRRARRWYDLAGVVAAVALVGVVALRDATWVVVLCALLAAAVATIALTGARSWVAIALSPGVGVLGALRTGPWAARGAVVAGGTRGKQATPLLRSAAVAVALLTVFGLLFASADAVFASLLPDLGLDLVPARVLTLVVVTGLVLVAMHVATTRPRWQVLSVPSGRPVRLVEWLVPVVALDALVVCFVAVQVGALLGGHRHVLATAGLSYAEYARQGFAQLVVVTALTLVVIAVAARYAPRARTTDRRASSAALAVLAVATLGVVVSALRRMDLYIDAFGLTRLRLVVAVFEVSLAVVLLLVLVAGVRWRGGWLPRAVTGTTVLAMLSFAVVNPDALIAERNIERYRAGADIDMGYLRGLSADAAPAIDRLPEPLRSCLLTGTDSSPAGGIGGWNLGRERAARIVRSRPPAPTSALDCYPET